jgi:hypothetical protein
LIDEYGIPVTQMIAYQSPNKSNTTDATAEAGTAYLFKLINLVVFLK